MPQDRRKGRNKKNKGKHSGENKRKMANEEDAWTIAMHEGRLISNAHSEISRKRDHAFKQTKVGRKVQYFSYKLTYLFFDIVALSFNTFFPT